MKQSPAPVFATYRGRLVLWWEMGHEELRGDWDPIPQMLAQARSSGFVPGQWTRRRGRITQSFMVELGMRPVPREGQTMFNVREEAGAFQVVNGETGEVVSTHQEMADAMRDMSERRQQWVPVHQAKVEAERTAAHEEARARRAEAEAEMARRKAAENKAAEGKTHGEAGEGITAAGDGSGPGFGSGQAGTGTPAEHDGDGRRRKADRKR